MDELVGIVHGRVDVPVADLDGLEARLDADLRSRLVCVADAVSGTMTLRVSQEAAAVTAARPTGDGRAVHQRQSLVFALHQAAACCLKHAQTPNPTMGILTPGATSMVSVADLDMMALM